MKKPILFLVVALFLQWQFVVHADEPKKGDEKENKEKKSWYDNIQLSGDFRFRHETILQENSPERNRERIRLRVAGEAEVADDFKCFLRLASGAPEPTSTNQTLDEGFSSKSIWLDLAYFELKPAAAKGFSLSGGKMKNPFYLPGESDLIWDIDVTPEGLAAKYLLALGTIEPFLTAGGFWVKERPADPDSYLLAGQGGANIRLSDTTELRFGVSYFDYQNAKNYETFYNTSNGYGDTTYTVGTNTYYLYQYGEIEGFAEVSIKAGNMPISLFCDYVSNHKVSKSKEGFLVGFCVGKAKNAGDWSLKCNYRRLEKDAVIGAFTDADCWGGGTNGKGIKVQFDIAVAKNTVISATGFLDKKDLDNEQDYKKFQVDISFKF